MSELPRPHSVDILELMDKPVPSANQLRDMHPLREGVEQEVGKHRQDIANILTGVDDRFLLIAGPCSLDGEVMADGTPAVLFYTRAMRAVMNDLQFQRLFKFVQRTNPAKPRSDVGPRGFEQNNLVEGHALLTSVVNEGVPLTFEIMNDKQLARYGDMLTMGWVGARDINNTDLRHAISAYSEIPFFFKNDEYGNMDPAERAQMAVAQEHLVEIHNRDNQLVHTTATGNHTTGLIDRGGSVHSPEEFMERMRTCDVAKRVIDASHFNGAAFSEGKKSSQGHFDCAMSVTDLIRACNRPMGIMLESYLLEGSGPEPGQSKTDPCLGLEQTIKVIEELARALTANQRRV